MQEVTLDGMPAVKRKKVIKKKKFIPTKNVPVEVSIRRQVSEEIGDGEPTKDQKFVLLQKYGVTAPRIDRLVTKPNFMGVSEWKRKQNDWFKATKGLVSPSQRPRFNRPNSTSQPSLPNLPASTVRPYPKRFSANLSRTSRSSRPRLDAKLDGTTARFSRNQRTDSRQNFNRTRTETPHS